MKFQYGQPQVYYEEIEKGAYSSRDNRDYVSGDEGIDEELVLGVDYTHEDLEDERSSLSKESEYKSNDRN